MHSTIFQIATEVIDKENFIDENIFAQGDYSFYDYCGEISDDDRKSVIKSLVNNLLPSGMFTLSGDDYLVYEGGINEWKEQWVARIHERAEAVSVSNITEGISAVYLLEKELKNPLDIGSRFCLESYPTSYAEESAELIKVICRLKPGDKLYVGGVLDYHW